MSNMTDSRTGFCPTCKMRPCYCPPLNAITPGYVTTRYVLTCGCGAVLNQSWRYCPECGKRL